MTTICFRNGETWTSLLLAKAVRLSASNIVSIKSGVGPSVRFKAESSPYECWKLFIDNAMQKSIQTHTIKEATKTNSESCLSMEKLEAFIALQYDRGIYGKAHSIDYL